MIQLHIFSEAVETEADAVAAILIAAAERFALHENTAASRLPGTIRSFCQSRFHGIGLGARFEENLIVIDLNPRDAAPLFAGEVYQFVSQEIFRSFPGRVRNPKPAQHVEIRQVLSVSSEMRRLLWQDID